MNPTKELRIFKDEFAGLDEYLFQKLPQCGTFVEIGANNGIKGSHCVELIKKGWSGISIEADPRTYKYLEKFYENVNQVSTFNYAVCKENGETTFYSHDEICSGVSSLFLEHANGKADPEGIIKRSVTEVIVKTKRLDTILSENNCKSIDYLQIDTEGADAEILLGTDFSVYKPKIIYAETNKLFYYLKDRDQSKSSEVWNLIMTHLSQFGYELLCKVDDPTYKQKYSPKIGDVPLSAAWILKKI